MSGRTHLLPLGALPFRRARPQEPPACQTDLCSQMQPRREGRRTKGGRGAKGRAIREQGGGQKGEKDLKEGWRWGGGGHAVTHTMPPPPPPPGHALHEKHTLPPPDGPGRRRGRGRLRGEPQQRRRVVDGLAISQTFALTQSLIVITDRAPPPPEAAEAAALPHTHTHTLPPPPPPPHTLLGPDHIFMFSRQ